MPELCPERTTLAAAVFYPKVDRAVVSLLSKADWELRRDASKNSRFFEIAHLLVRFDHIACCIVNANHSVM